MEVYMYCKKCGKEIGNDAAFCPYCGDKVYGSAEPADESNALYGVLSFFLPVVGLILYFVWHDTYPLRAKSVGKGLCICVIMYAVLILLCVLIAVIAFLGISACAWSLGCL